MKPLELVLATARGGVIGKDGKLPWHLPEDLQRFKELTTGHAVIMGRKTHESIGRPLPNRVNVVVTRDRGRAFEGCTTAATLEEAIAIARSTDDAPFVIGGAAIYEAALPLATKVHLTKIDRDVEGDARVHLDLKDFELIEEQRGTSADVVFQTWARRA